MLARRALFRFLPLALIALAVIAIVSACAPAPRWSERATDAEMTLYFQGHKAEFVRLLGLLQQEPKIGYMSRQYNDLGTPTRIALNDTSGNPVTGSRAQQILALWDELDLKFIGYQEGQFDLENMSVSDDGPGKSFVYSASPPSPLVQTETQAAGGNSHVVYRAIGDGWYIQYAPGI